jgi:esterase/lipase
VIGGKSMGGRIASMLADQAGIKGLVCLGYPFHPRGQAQRLRVEHLRALRTPTLKPPKRSGRTLEQNMEEAITQVAGFFSRLYRSGKRV